MSYAGSIGLLAVGEMEDQLYKNGNAPNEFVKMKPTLVDNQNVIFSMYKAGDIIKECFLVIDLPLNNGHWAEDIGDYIIKKISLILDYATCITSYDANYSHIYNILSNKKPFRKLIGNTITIPLNLFDSEGLPLIKLYTHDIKICVEFEDMHKLIVGNDLACVEYHALPKCHIMAKYVHLPEKYRKVFKTTIETRVIEQVQCVEYLINDVDNNIMNKYMKNYTYENNVSICGIKCINDIIFSYLINDNNQYTIQFEMPFTNPSKELAWFIVSHDDPKEQFNYADFIQNATITLFGHKLVDEPSHFFTQMQQYINHSNYLENVHLYAFGNEPELKNIPNGTLNFSRISSAILELKIIPKYDKLYKLKIYSTNFNLFKLGNGYGEIM